MYQPKQDHETPPLLAFVIAFGACAAISLAVVLHCTDASAAKEKTVETKASATTVDPKGTPKKDVALTPKADESQRRFDGFNGVHPRIVPMRVYEKPQAGRCLEHD